MDLLVLADARVLIVGGPGWRSDREREEVRSYFWFTSWWGVGGGRDLFMNNLLAAALVALCLAKSGRVTLSHLNRFESVLNRSAERIRFRTGWCSGRFRYVGCRFRNVFGSSRFRQVGFQPVDLGRFSTGWRLEFSSFTSVSNWSTVLVGFELVYGFSRFPTGLRF